MHFLSLRFKASSKSHGKLVAARTITPPLLSEMPEMVKRNIGQFFVPISFELITITDHAGKQTKSNFV